MATSCPNPAEWAHLAHEARYQVAPFAKRIGLSPRQLRRHSRHHFGCSTRDYLAALRTWKAQQDLQAGQPPKQVASCVHLKQIASLYHLFKRRTGTTPGQHSPSSALTNQWPIQTIK